MKPNFPLTELRRLLADAKTSSGIVELSKHINSKISERDACSPYLSPSLIYLTIPVIDKIAGLEIYFAVRLEKDNQTEPTYYSFTQVLALEALMKILPKGVNKRENANGLPA